MIVFPHHWVHPTVSALVVATPVDAMCAACRKPLKEGDQGVWLQLLDYQGPHYKPWHRTCFLRSVLCPGIKCYDCCDTGRVRIPDGIAPCLCGAVSYLRV